jgi:hypothetical protein
VTTASAGRSWHLKPLKEHAAAVKLPDRAVQAVGDIAHMQEIFRYHMRTARDAIEFVEGVDSANEKLARVFTASVQQREVGRNKLIAEANLLAALHTANSVAQMFAQIVNFFVIRPEIAVHKCDLDKVQARLPASFVALTAAIPLLQSSPSSLYVRAFINVVKHRWLVRHSLDMDMTQDDFTIRVAPFEYRESSFPARRAMDVLRDSIQVFNAVGACGAALNDDLLLGSGPADREGGVGVVPPPS